MVGAEAPAPDPIIWSFVSAWREPYFIRESEIEYYAAPRNGFRAWVHGEHSGNPKVPYRTSLWLIEFNCRGGYTFAASTTYRADGSRYSNWDGSSAYEHIRPNSMYADLQDKLCRD